MAHNPFLSTDYVSQLRYNQGNFRVRFSFARYAETPETGRAQVVGIVARADLRVMSDQMLPVPLAMLGSSYVRPVPILQQFAGGHPSGGNDVHSVPAVAAQRRGSPS